MHGLIGTLACAELNKNQLTLELLLISMCPKSKACGKAIQMWHKLIINTTNRLES